MSRRKNVNFCSKVCSQKEVSCKNCSKLFVPKWVNRNTFCSVGCNLEFRTKNILLWKTTEKLCEVCGGKFLPHEEEQKCCSYSCGGKIREGKYERTCSFCSKEYVSRLKHKKVKFCSRECYHKSKKNPQSAIVCKMCKQEFIVEYRFRNQQYCSQACMGKMRSIQNISLRIPATCQTCNKEFKLKPSRVNKKGNYCCYDCFKESIPGRIIKGEYDYYRRPFKRGYFFSTKSNKKMFYRSSYELAALEKLEKDVRVIKFDTEALSISYEIEGKTRNYIPDLHVEVRGTTVAKIIEIKPKRFLTEKMNIAKFAAAEKYAEINGLTFSVLTEDDVFSDERLDL